MFIDEYLDRVKKKNNLTSDRQIAPMLGVGFTAPSQWRTKRAWPSDDTMEKLAIMAGLDAEKALIELNIWRSQGQAKSAYENVLKRLNNVAVSILAFVASILMFSTSVHATSIPPANEICCIKPVVLYITENSYVNKLKGILNNILSLLFNDLHTKYLKNI